MTSWPAISRCRSGCGSVPQVNQGGRYRVGLGLIEIDGVELVPFAAITDADVRRAGESDRETLRERAAQARPIDEPTFSGSSCTR
jgi:hypothetical protein